MRQIVNIREINQHLSRYIQSLDSEGEVIITRRGKAVAKLVPVTESKVLDSKQQQALERLRKRVNSGYSLGGQGVDRDSLYER